MRIRPSPLPSGRVRDWISDKTGKFPYCPLWYAVFDGSTSPAEAHSFCELVSHTWREVLRVGVLYPYWRHVEGRSRTDHKQAGMVRGLRAETPVPSATPNFQGAGRFLWRDRQVSTMKVRSLRISDLRPEGAAAGRLWQYATLAVRRFAQLRQRPGSQKVSDRRPY
jgi:hypothetical protein